MVLVVAQHDLPKPSTDFGHAIMPSALKLDLDGLELRNHSLFRSDPTYGEGSALVALPTVVGEAQEREGLRFPLSTQLPVASGEPTSPCGVPRFVSDHWPSSDIPALSHFRIRRSILRSATRCSMNFIVHSWLMLSKKPRMSASSTQFTPLPLD